MAGSRKKVREQESTEGKARDIESVKVLGSDSRCSARRVSRGLWRCVEVVCML